MSQLKVNLTEQEATSQVRDIPPSGEYVCNIVDGKEDIVKPNKKNSGKPYWKMKYVVQEGAYAGSTLSATVMLFEGALYSFSQLMKALGYEVNVGGLVVPEVDTLLGKTVIVKGYKRPPSTNAEGQDLPERFEVRGYKPARMKTKTGDTSLLP